MRRNNLAKLLIASIAASVAILLSSGCRVNVQKEANGQDKKVDIETLAGGIHINKDADASDVGIPVYPGARLKEKDSNGSDKSANVNLSGFGFGLKVVALEYRSDDTPSKVLAFYRDQLKKFGSVLECHTSGLNVQMKMDTHSSKNDSNQLTCEGSAGTNIELKVGYKDDQHIVAVQPDGSGSSFSLVYVRTHGKGADI